VFVVFAHAALASTSVTNADASNAAATAAMGSATIDPSLVLDDTSLAELLQGLPSVVPLADDGTAPPPQVQAQPPTDHRLPPSLSALQAMPSMGPMYRGNMGPAAPLPVGQGPQGCERHHISILLTLILPPSLRHVLRVLSCC